MACHCCDLSQPLLGLRGTWFRPAWTTAPRYLPLTSLYHRELCVTCVEVVQSYICHGSCISFLPTVFYSTTCNSCNQSASSESFSLSHDSTFCTLFVILTLVTDKIYHFYAPNSKRRKTWIQSGRYWIICNFARCRDVNQFSSLG